MKPLLIVANFKSNKTKAEAKNWLDEITKIKDLNLSDKQIIVCPPFTLLDYFKSYIDENSLPIELCAQDISRFPQGAYTGEVNGSQIKEFAEYVLIGHSERRTGFNEDESVLEEKVKMSIDYNLIPIFFVQDESTEIPQGLSIVVYEPPSAISTSPNPVVESPETADEVAKKLKEVQNLNVLYGGSITPGDVRSFTEKSDISGVLVGDASLNAAEFLGIIKNA